MRKVRVELIGLQDAINAALKEDTKVAGAFFLSLVRTRTLNNTVLTFLVCSQGSCCALLACTSLRLASSIVPATSVLWPLTHDLCADQKFAGTSLPILAIIVSLVVGVRFRCGSCLSIVRSVSSQCPAGTETHSCSSMSDQCPTCLPSACCFSRATASTCS